MSLNDENAGAPARVVHTSGAHLDIARDLDELSTRAAELFVTLAQQAAQIDDGRFTVALSGGETPKRLYNLLSTHRYADQITWQTVHFFWGDERHVPPDDPESDYGMAYHALLSKVPIPAENIHRIRAELPDAAEAAREYETDLRGLFSLQPDELPRFDLVLLGMGNDGHTASLFPGTDALHDDTHLVVAPWVDKFNTYRITLTPKVLNNAATIVFLASGAGKAPVLREVLEGERHPDLYPAQLIAPTHGELLWMVDRAAVAELRLNPTTR